MNAGIPLFEGHQAAIVVCRRPCGEQNWKVCCYWGTFHWFWMKLQQCCRQRLQPSSQSVKPVLLCVCLFSLHPKPISPKMCPNINKILYCKKKYLLHQINMSWFNLPLGSSIYIIMTSLINMVNSLCKSALTPLNSCNCCFRIPEQKFRSRME